MSISVFFFEMQHIVNSKDDIYVICLKYASEMVDRHWAFLINSLVLSKILDFGQKKAVSVIFTLTA